MKRHFYLFIFTIFLSFSLQAKEIRLECIVNGKETIAFDGGLKTTPIENIKAAILIEEENNFRRISIIGNSEIKNTVVNSSSDSRLNIFEKSDSKQFLITNTKTVGKDVDKVEIKIDRVFGKIFVKSSSLMDTGLKTFTSFNGDCSLIKNIPKF
jgi:hypothetical protein